jgi:hypothetical protein
MDLEFHPLANCLPLIEGTEFDELVADIKERGLALPIELYEGKILDGRNRYRACRRLGIEPLIVTYAGTDPAARVTSLNLRRRHLTASQRAMAAAKMANMRSGARTDLGHSLSEVSIKRAADLHKVGTTSVKQAHTVLREGGAGRRGGGWNHPRQACRRDRTAAVRTAARGDDGADGRREEITGSKTPEGDCHAQGIRPQA